MTVIATDFLSISIQKLSHPIFSPSFIKVIYILDLNLCGIKAGSGKYKF